MMGMNCIDCFYSNIAIDRPSHCSKGLSQYTSDTTKKILCSAYKYSWWIEIGIIELIVIMYLIYYLSYLA